MGKAKRVLTPGSYSVTGSKKIVSKKKKKVGRPSVSTKAKKKPVRSSKYRERYTAQDVLEAIRLVKQEDYSISCACEVINETKVNRIPRMTLSDRLRSDTPHQVAICWQTSGIVQTVSPDLPGRVLFTF
jgi:hypothetical protein